MGIDALYDSLAVSELFSRVGECGAVFPVQCTDSDSQFGAPRRAPRGCPSPPDADVAAHHRLKRARCCQFACYTMPLDSGTLPHVLRC